MYSIEFMDIIQCAKIFNLKTHTRGKNFLTVIYHSYTDSKRFLLCGPEWTKAAMHTKI